MSTTNGSTDNTTPATTTLVDPYEQFAAREGGPEFFEGDLIKFVKGKWERGQDKQAIGATEMFTANLAELHEGWIRFEDGRVADREIGRVASGYVHPPRESLGELDKRQWRKDSRGEPRDPWERTIYLPMLDNAGEPCCFTGNSGGAFDAVAKLTKAFAHAPQRAEGKMPKLMLAVDEYEHRDYGTISKPVLKIIGWDLLNGQPAPEIPKVPMAPKVRPAAARAAVSQSKDGKRDLEDEIPF